MLIGDRSPHALTYTDITGSQYSTLQYSWNCREQHLELSRDLHSAAGKESTIVLYQIAINILYYVVLYCNTLYFTVSYCNI